MAPVPQAVGQVLGTRQGTTWTHPRTTQLTLETARPLGSLSTDKCFSRNYAAGRGQVCTKPCALLPLSDPLTHEHPWSPGGSPGLQRGGRDSGCALAAWGHPTRTLYAVLDAFNQLHGQGATSWAAAVTGHGGPGGEPPVPRGCPSALRDVSTGKALARIHSS